MARVQVLRARVNWMEEWANDAHLEILLDHIPSHDGYRYERRGGLYFAEHEGVCHYFFYTRPGEGFGGCTFKLTMKDGTTAVLKGPWSSSSSAMNFAGFEPSVEVGLTADPESYARGYTFFAGAVTLEVAQEAAAMANTKLVYTGDGRPSMSDLSSEQIGVVQAGGHIPSLWLVDPEEKARRQRAADERRELAYHARMAANAARSPR